MPLEYYRKDSYGRKLLWLADKDLASGFTKLTGRKTITAEDMKALVEMVALMSGVAIRPQEVVEPKVNNKKLF